MAKKTLIIATRNAHQTAEIRAMLGDDYDLLDPNDFDNFPAVEETGVTFLEKGKLKAQTISRSVSGDGVLGGFSPACQAMVLVSRIKNAARGARGHTLNLEISARDVLQGGVVGEAQRVQALGQRFTVEHLFSLCGNGRDVMVMSIRWRWWWWW